MDDVDEFMAKYVTPIVEPLREGLKIFGEAVRKEFAPILDEVEIRKHELAVERSGSASTRR